MENVNARHCFLERDETGYVGFRVLDTKLFFLYFFVWLFHCCDVPNTLIHSSPAGVFAFGLFATDIFVNAGQVVTGGLSPYFLSVCKPNYTGTECRFNHQFIINGNICTGNPIVVENARRSFPSKDASLSVYSAVYLTVGGICLALRFTLWDLFSQKQLGFILCLFNLASYSVHVFNL